MAAAFTLWIDADATQRDVKDLIYRAAERMQIRTVLVANGSLTVPRSAYISTVRVGLGLNVADAYIVKSAVPGDVVVTADIPLAAELVPKGVIVIDPRGDLYDDDNIQERLSLRNFMQEMRDSGVSTGGPKAFDARAKQQFANALDRVLQQAVRRPAPRP
jgi:uncharacterized protein YaiI (UPF0178 family)